jgi:hypothetical protein
MDSKISKTFKDAKYHSDVNLSNDIWLFISKREDRKNKIKTWTYSVSGFISLFLLFPAIKNLITELSGRGFYEYLSLAVSDFEVVMTYSKEFTMSLLNSLPVVSLTASLFLLFILFTSVQRISVSFRNKLLLA